MASPYEIGGQIGKGISGAFSAYRQDNTMDQLLQQASKSEDPNQVQNLMGMLVSQVAPERRQDAMQLLTARLSDIKGKEQRQRQMATAQKYGYNVDDPDMVKKEIVKGSIGTDQFNQFMGGQGFGGAPEGGGQAVPGSGGAQPAQGVSPFDNLNDSQLEILTGHPNKMISEPAKQKLNSRQENRNIQTKRDETRMKFGQDIGKKVLERADEIAEALPQKEAALKLMVDSIANKNLDFWSWDNIAEATGVEGLRSPEGALFKTASKEYFLGNIVRAGARPNQWIEQQIADMMTKVGRSTEANLSVSRALQNELDIEKERVRLTSEISDEIDAGDGDYRKIGARVQERLSKYAEAKQSELFNDLRAIKSIGEGKPQKFQRVSKGTKVSPYVVDALLVTFNNNPEKAMQEAIKLGYSVDE